MRKLSYQFPANIPTATIYRIATAIRWNMPGVNTSLSHIPATDAKPQTRYTLEVEGEEDEKVGTAILFARFSIDLLTKE